MKYLDTTPSGDNECSEESLECRRADLAMKSCALIKEIRQLLVDAEECETVDEEALWAVVAWPSNLLYASSDFIWNLEDWAPYHEVEQS